METSHRIELENLPERLKLKKKQGETLEELEKSSIKRGLDQYGWTDEGKILVAQSLGVSRSTIYRKIRKYKLTRDSL